MLQRYALVGDKEVVNVVEYEEGAVKPPEGFKAIQSDTANIGDAWDGKNIIAPPPPPIAWDYYQQRAKAILFHNDLIAIRCVKAGISYPAHFQSCDEACRAIMRSADGDTSQPLPEILKTPDGI